MKTWKHGIFGIIAIIALVFALTACDDKPDHTHEWEWKETTAPTLTADGEATETCKTCGATRGTKPIAKLGETVTHTININITNDIIIEIVGDNKVLKFDVKYEKLYRI